MAAVWVAATGMILHSLVPESRAVPLVWDSTAKEQTAETGQTNVTFTFAFTNVSNTEVIIHSVRPSCGCTTAKIPPLPWKIAPGGDGKFDVVADIRGKRGVFSKSVSVATSAGINLLSLKVHIPEDARLKNQMLAMTDRQAIFKNDCASCHVQPAVGLHGEPLYYAACGICHEAEHRASMVPDLKALQHTPDFKYWHTWVSKGKEHTLMPGFAKSEGGPLDEEQVRSLADFLTHRFPPRQSFGGLTPYHDD